MIKNSTLTTINQAADHLAKAFVIDAEMGMTTPEMVQKTLKRVKYPTLNEFIEATIREDHKQIDKAWKDMGININLSNLLKRKYFSRFLANEIANRLQIVSRKNESVKKILDMIH